MLKVAEDNSDTLYCITYNFKTFMESMTDARNERENEKKKKQDENTFSVNITGSDTNLKDFMKNIFNRNARTGNVDRNAQIVELSSTNYEGKAFK